MTELLTAFTTLFVIIDPIGLAPIFLAMTAGMSPARRRAIASRACIIGALILFAFSFLGEALLGFVGISMPAFRIAGGILLFLTALEMLFQRRQARRQDNADEAQQENQDDPSVFPIAIPLIAGPGAIASIILLTGNGDGLWHLSVLGVMVFVILIVFGLFMLAAPLERILGQTGTNVVTRLLGMLLAALAVQFILTGLKDFGFAG
jgi:multiple antibiotic resistance protein